MTKHYRIKKYVGNNKAVPIRSVPPIRIQPLPVKIQPLPARPAPRVVPPKQGAVPVPQALPANPQGIGVVPVILPQEAPAQRPGVKKD